MELTRFAVLTTCHAAGLKQYGRRMVETFDLLARQFSAL